MDAESFKHEILLAMKSVRIINNRLMLSSGDRRMNMQETSNKNNQKCSIQERRHGEDFFRVIFLICVNPLIFLRV